jgi:hypothetical protein
VSPVKVLLVHVPAHCTIEKHGHRHGFKSPTGTDGEYIAFRRWFSVTRRHAA